MILPSHEIKRQILKSVDTSPFNKKMENPGISRGEMLEIGNELEKITKAPGWTIIETYMMNRMNLVGLVQEGATELSRGVAKGFIELMQYIDLAIRRRNKILEEERLNHEAKNVPEDEAE